MENYLEWTVNKKGLIFNDEAERIMRLYDAEMRLYDAEMRNYLPLQLSVCLHLVQVGHWAYSATVLGRFSSLFLKIDKF